MITLAFSNNEMHLKNNHYKKCNGNIVLFFTTNIYIMTDVFSYLRTISSMQMYILVQVYKLRKLLFGNSADLNRGIFHLNN